MIILTSTVYSIHGKNGLAFVISLYQIIFCSVQANYTSEVIGGSEVYNLETKWSLREEKFPVWNILIMKVNKT